MHRITGLKKIIFAILGLSIGLFASADCIQGIQYFEDKEYNKAFPIILKAAKRGVNKTAQYRLAEMYEKGLGTKVDYKESMYWYKKVASKYTYSNKKQTFDTNSSLLQRLNSQLISNDNMKAGNEFGLSKLDTNTPETKSFLTSLIDGNFFGLKPHKANYFLPLSYSKDKPNRVDSIYGHNGLPDEYNQYNNNTEAIFQFSIRKDLSYNLFGFNEFITVAYTQKVWWQLYDDSAPFRETNSQAEIFLLLPTSQNIDDYLGNGDIEIGYLYGKSQLGLLLRNNLHIDDNKGAVEFTYSYPFFSSPNTFWYTKIFTGYGDSMIDYNVDVTKASFGFSFSRGLF